MVEKDRTKHLSFIIKPSISYNDYLVAILITIGSIFAFYLLFIIIYFYCSRRGFKPRAMAYVEENEVEDVITPTSTLGKVTHYVIGIIIAG